MVTPGCDEHAVEFRGVQGTGILGGKTSGSRHRGAAVVPGDTTYISDQQITLSCKQGRCVDPDRASRQQRQSQLCSTPEASWSPLHVVNHTSNGSKNSQPVLKTHTRGESNDGAQISKATLWPHL